MKAKKYIIITDESKRHGENYSYFYGGCIIEEKNYENIDSELKAYKDYLGFNEIKREKITQYNIGEYKKIIDMFFRYIKSGDIKFRVMYSPNNQLNQYPHGQDELYSKFYYTFFKRGFSLLYAKQNINLKILMDELPESLKVRKKFKRHLITCFVKSSNQTRNKISLYNENIVEVDSKEHVILQCVDVITGVIEFFLNSTEEGKRGSKRAKAKIELFNHIYYNYILLLCENFDFNISTGYFNCYKAWTCPYKHLVFKQKK